MTKKELIKNVSGKIGMTQVATSEIVNAVFEEIADTLAQHEEVYVNGFGRFVAVYQEEKECRNPKTGEQVTVEARYAPRFKPSAALKDLVK